MKLLKGIVLCLLFTLLGPTHISHATSRSVEEEILLIDLDDWKKTANLSQKYIDYKRDELGEDKYKYYQDMIDKNIHNIKILEKLQVIYKDNERIRQEIRSNVQNRNHYFSIDIDRFIPDHKLSKLIADTFKEDEYFYYGQYDNVNVRTIYDVNKVSFGRYKVDRVDLEVTYRSSLATELETKNYVRQWISENISPNDSDYFKVKKIHDFIVKKNQYNTGDESNMSGGYSIYHPSSIIYGQGGVCNAYASLFKLLADGAGLESTIVTGNSLQNGEDHMWNMVKVDGNYYHIDTTWDDPIIDFNSGEVVNLEDFVIYDYFLKSDQEIQKSRSIDEDENRPRAAESYYYSPDNSKIEELGGIYWVV